MATFKEIEEARRLLGLGETAKLKEIKRAFRTLAHRYHPDKNTIENVDEAEIMKRLNWAYKILMDYCNEYKYSFGQEDVARVYPDEDDYNKWRENWPF
ncbi:MAG: J domain-containing protein [Dehalococcoidales bacterium]|nr:J domain-containing protein [Dehalococcoidales bacterium]